MPVGVACTRPFACASEFCSELHCWTRTLDIVDGQRTGSKLEHREAHRCAGASGTDQHHIFGIRVGHAAFETFSKAPPVGIVSNAPAMSEQHGIHSRQSACLG